MSILVRNVSKRFGEFTALDDVSLEVEGGSLTALLGPSGSGKSTLLRIISGLEVPDSGEILISGEDATALSPQKRNVGFVFQHYAAFKHMTVRDNIAFGLKVRKRPKAEIRDRVDQLLQLVQLEAFGHRYPAQLSGGQRQRMALARALRRRAAGPAARRAVRRPRRPRPCRAARMAAPAPRRGARDDDLRHARPGRGDGRREPDRRHESRPDRTGGLTDGALRRARNGVRDELRRRSKSPRCELGTTARARRRARAPTGCSRGDGRAHHALRLRRPHRAERSGR